MAAAAAAEGEIAMTTSNPETITLEAAPPVAPAEPKAPTKPNTTPRKPRVAPAKGQAGTKASTAKKRAKKPKAAKPAEGAREGSKAARVLDLLKRPKGATLGELMKATGWQAHSVRGFLSGTLGKKMGLKLDSAKRDGERVYSISR